MISSVEDFIHYCEHRVQRTEYRIQKYVLISSLQRPPAV